MSEYRPPTFLYKIERILDAHNHLLEFFRTIGTFVSVTLQIIIILKIFNFI